MYSLIYNDTRNKQSSLTIYNSYTNDERGNVTDDESLCLPHMYMCGVIGTRPIRCCGKG